MEGQLDIICNTGGEQINIAVTVIPQEYSLCIYFANDLTVQASKVTQRAKGGFSGCNYSFKLRRKFADSAQNF